MVLPYLKRKYCPRKKVTGPDGKTAMVPKIAMTCTSFMVNLFFVKSIRRFEITLSDGTILPVPDRKYSKISKLLQE